MAVDIVISDDKTKLQLSVIHEFLSASYWSEGIPIRVVENAIKNSICFGVYLQDIQIGFARVITDESTFAYLADVFILEEYRRKGYSKKLMEHIMNYPSLQGLRRWVLATRDAHGLYEQFGFHPLSIPERWMENHNPEIYRKNTGPLNRK